MKFEEKKKDFFFIIISIKFNKEMMTMGSVGVPKSSKRKRTRVGES